METRTYKVSKAEKPSGGSAYRLDGPGLKPERVYYGEETRERLEDVVELMNFAFEQGRQALVAELRARSRLGAQNSDRARSEAQHDHDPEPPARIAMPQDRRA